MLLPTLRALLVLVVVSPGLGIAYLSVLAATGRGPSLVEAIFWIGSELGFAALAMLLLRTVLCRPVC